MRQAATAVEARTVEVRADALLVGDTVVSSSGATWTVDALSTYTDRDGRSQVAATGVSGRGTRFSLQRRGHQHVRTRLEARVTVQVEAHLH